MNKKRMISVAGIALMLATVFFACKEEVPVSGVTLDKTALTLTLEETAVLKATVEPANAAVQTVTWSAEPAGVVTLKADGNSCTLAYVGDGTATVTVKTADGGKTAQCRVTAAGALTNLALITAVETAIDSQGNPVNIGWTKEEGGTVKLTAENLEKIRAVTELNIASRGLSNLSGIEWFGGLTYLNCYNNQLTALDVSANTALKTLKCYKNQLTTLDVSANTALKTLKCYKNQLTEMDVSANTALETLYCYSNQLTELDLSANTALQTLWCFTNQLTTLDVSGCTVLETLDCSDNQLTELDITKLTALKEWYCGWQTSDGTAEQKLKLILTEEQYVLWKDGLENHSVNERVTVEVAGGFTAAVSGVTLDYTECRLITGDAVTLTAAVEPANAADKTVNWSAEPADAVTLTDNGDGSCTVRLEKEVTATVTVTTADGGKTAQCTVTVADAYDTIDNSTFVKAVGIQCGWTVEGNGTVRLTPENLKAVRAVTRLNISEQGLTDLSGIGWFTGLTDLDCTFNQLTELDVSANTALTYLNCSGNQLTKLDVSGCTALYQLYCCNNQLTTLDVSGCTALTILSCYSNRLASLNVSGCTTLTTLDCQNNQLTTLNVSANTALKILHSYENQLTELDVSANMALTTLYCYSNQLTTLDVSANMALTTLYCYSNQLTTLDVSANTALTDLLCGLQGATPQTLMLTLNEDQKTTWINEWENYGLNNDVAVAQ